MKFLRFMFKQYIFNEIIEIEIQTTHFTIIFLRLMSKQYILNWNSWDWFSNHTFYYEIIKIDVQTMNLNEILAIEVQTTHFTLKFFILMTKTWNSIKYLLKLEIIFIIGLKLIFYIFYLLVARPEAKQNPWERTSAGFVFCTLVSR